MDYFLGIDVGSVATKLVILDNKEQVKTYSCLPTHGQPIFAVKKGLAKVKQKIAFDNTIQVCVTGSARELVKQSLGADMIKNEVSCHATATLHYYPKTRTIVEIGGQDSKIILLEDGMVTDFGMNTVCAAGTGSFIDHQVQRLGLKPEQFGELVCRSQKADTLTGHCTVFAESEIIHKQQSGTKLEDIAYGLCQMLVQNYLNSVAAGKEISSPLVFQGGLAFNKGIVRVLQEELEMPIIVPPFPQMMGALGAALLAKRLLASNVSGLNSFENKK
ncbi:MAG: acyl-CoA dehydratase activase [Dehalococcoidia bacterium]|nr:acyl-CoA dehydratase activase [Dehalococcoidia bacterium]